LYRTLRQGEGGTDYNYGARDLGDVPEKENLLEEHQTSARSSTNPGGKTERR
jgi:hypothetical protein